MNRNIEDLSSPFKEKVKAFLIHCKLEWINDIFITEWLRTKQRQAELFAQWRTTPWRIVTWSMSSNHLIWQAIDVASKWKELYPKNDKWWNDIFRIAKIYWIDNLWEKQKLEKAHLENWKTTIQSTIKAISELWQKVWANDKMELHRLNEKLRSLKLN